jgi:hypothetical protein
VLRPLRIAAAAAIALAALSLLLPYQPVYDPWGWLVWGRELAHLDLATGAGPSWKPLPVFINAPLSLLGEAAPEVWLLVARTGWLLAPALAAWLVARLAGPGAGRWRYVGAALAAASVALTGDAFTPPTRQFTGGLSEPMGVALILGAVAMALERRPVGALWLGIAASLLRPECWPFLAAWAIWEMRRNPRLRPHAIAAAISIPLAWFVPDLIGAGNPLEGSETARNGGLELSEVSEVFGRALIAPLAAIWIGVALFLAAQPSGATHMRPISPSLRFTGSGEGVREGDAALWALLAGAVGWVALVAVMAVAGFAGLPRFLAPATAVIAVVGGIGLARAGAAGRALTGIAISALVLGVGGFALRAAQVPGDLETVNRQANTIDALFGQVDRIGPDRLLACGNRTGVTQLLVQTPVAWKLDQSISAVPVVRRRQAQTWLVLPAPEGTVARLALPARGTHCPH